MVHELNKVNAGKASWYVPIRPAGLEPGEKLSNVITICPDGSLTIIVASEGFEKKILCLCCCHWLHIFVSSWVKNTCLFTSSTSPKMPQEIIAYNQKYFHYTEKGNRPQYARRV